MHIVLIVLFNTALTNQKDNFRKQLLVLDQLDLLKNKFLFLHKQFQNPKSNKNQNMTRERIVLRVEKFNPERLVWEMLPANITSRIEENADNYVMHSILMGCNDHLNFNVMGRSSNFENIHKPKGLPSNSSEGMYDLVHTHRSKQHSHSYLYISELEDYNWNQVVGFSALVDAGEYMRHKQGGRPRTFCKFSGLHVLTNAEMDVAIKTGSSYGEMTRVQWDRPITEFVGCKEFVFEDLPTLRQLAGNNPRSVRLVFFMNGYRN
jgi:hypothetical protein